MLDVAEAPVSGSIVFSGSPLVLAAFDPASLHGLERVVTLCRADLDASGFEVGADQRKESDEGLLVVLAKGGKVALGHLTEAAGA